MAAAHPLVLELGTTDDRSLLDHGLSSSNFQPNSDWHIGAAAPCLKLSA